MFDSDCVAQTLKSVTDLGKPPLFFLWGWSGGKLEQWVVLGHAALEADTILDRDRRGAILIAEGADMVEAVEEEEEEVAAERGSLCW